jgi:hypothetical protein
MGVNGDRCGWGPNEDDSLPDEEARSGPEPLMVASDLGRESLEVSKADKALARILLMG